jgi:hypothetical protein
MRAAGMRLLDAAEGWLCRHQPAVRRFLRAARLVLVVCLAGDAILLGWLVVLHPLFDVLAGSAP